MKIENSKNKNKEFKGGYVDKDIKLFKKQDGCSRFYIETFDDNNMKININDKDLEKIEKIIKEKIKEITAMIQIEMNKSVEKNETIKNEITKKNNDICFFNWFDSNGY